MALQGSLAGMGISEILQLAGVQQKTGILHVTSESEGSALQILMIGGRIVGCHAERPEKRDLLGQRLLAAGAVSKDQLNKGLKAARKANVLLATQLIDDKAINAATRDHFIMLQMRERLAGVFEWKRGNYRFENKPRGFTNATQPSLSAEAILMDGFRMMDEWPLIRTKINNYDTVYKVIRDPEDEESEAEALERVLDDAFSEFVGDDEDDFGDLGGGLGRHERTVFDLIDGKRSVQRLIDLGRIGEFETCKALVSLLSDGYIEATKQRKARFRGRGRRQSPLAIVGTILINLAVLGAIVGAIWLLPSTRIQLDANAAAVAKEAAERLRTNRVVALSMALEVFRYEHGQYPESLEELVTADVVDAALLDEAPGLRYTSVGTDYDLR